MLHDHVHSSTRHAWPKALRFVSALSLLAFTILGSIGACQPATTTPFCEGGIVSPSGACEGICDPTKCLAGNICVDNRCVLECDAHADCAEDGSQNCAPAIEDKTARSTMTCQASNTPTGIGVSCPFGDECAGLFSCSTTGERCDTAQCGGAFDTCKRDEQACYARANCNIGKCADGTACTVFSCSAQECVANLACVTKGDADADAYCSKNNCQADTDCPGGYYCGVTRDPREICDSMPPKGNNNLCGKVSINTPCVPASDLGDGKPLFEGQACILQKTCLKRNECAPCATDLDCSQGIANHCITMPKEAQKRCANECLSNKDCGRDFSCEALDPNDTTKGNVCVHRFGACEGTGKFCEPCLDDTSCGPITGKSVCITHNDGQRGCAYNVPCATDADCPQSPSGSSSVCDAGTCTSFTVVVINVNDTKYTCW